MSKRGLGRGLDALISTTGVQASEQENIAEIAVREIVANRFQPRRLFEPEKLSELAESIKQYGVLQPVVVRRMAKGFELVAGERRWRASQLAGLRTIPAVVRSYTDSQMTEIALIENLQRQDLNPIEEAFAYRRLMDEFNLTQDVVANRVGRSRSYIANMVRLIHLPDAIQDFVSRGTLTMGQTRPLLALENEELQILAARRIIDEDLSARDAEELVRKLNESPTERQVSPRIPKEVFMAEAEDRLKMLLGTKVHIKPGKLKSRIEIEFHSAEELDRIIETMSSTAYVPTHKVRANFIV
ncbi:MAG: parB-like partition protein [Firmicutes bacterium]|nr:parB-like partition protein [Bacillota bacterium]